MACFFVCGANNVKPIKIDDPSTAVINQPIPKKITNHIQHCPHCHKKYNEPTMNNVSHSKGITTFQQIENALYLSTHFPPAPAPGPYPHYNRNLHLTQSISPLTPRTPKTPTIDPDSALRVKDVIQYSPSRSGTYTTHSPNTSVLVDMYTHTASDNYNYKSKTIRALQINQSTSSTVHDLYVPRPVHDIDGDLINAALSPIFNEIHAKDVHAHKDITSKCLPPPMHKFNQLSIDESGGKKTKTKKRKKVYTPSNSPKDHCKRKHLWKKADGLSTKQKKKMDKIIKKVQKLKDAEAKQSRKQKRRNKDVLTHVHHHHEHFHHHHYHHHDDAPLQRQRKEMVKRNKRKYRAHSNTNGFFTEKYKHKYMPYFEKTPELSKKYKKKPKTRKEIITAATSTRYYPEYEEGFEGCVRPPIAIGNPLSVLSDECDGKEATKSTQSQSSFSYEYHSD